MKKIILITIAIFLFGYSSCSQKNKNSLTVTDIELTDAVIKLSAADIEYSKLSSDLFDIINEEFILPLITNELQIFYGMYYGYGYHQDPFTGKPWFSTGTYIICNEGSSIYSMTPGVVIDIVYDRMIIIEYKGIEISYRDLNIANINIGDTISSGQLLGSRRGVDAMHNYFQGIIIKLKYKSYYFDLGYLLKENEKVKYIRE